MKVLKPIAEDLDKIVNRLAAEMLCLEHGVRIYDKDLNKINNPSIWPIIRVKPKKACGAPYIIQYKTSVGYVFYTASADYNIEIIIDRVKAVISKYSDHLNGFKYVNAEFSSGLYMMSLNNTSVNALSGASVDALSGASVDALSGESVDALAYNLAVNPAANSADNHARAIFHYKNSAPIINFYSVIANFTWYFLPCELLLYDYSINSDSDSDKNKNNNNIDDIDDIDNIDNNNNIDNDDMLNIPRSEVLAEKIKRYNLDKTYHLYMSSIALDLGNFICKRDNIEIFDLNPIDWRKPIKKAKTISHNLALIIDPDNNVKICNPLIYDEDYLWDLKNKFNFLEWEDWDTNKFKDAVNDFSINQCGYCKIPLSEDVIIIRASYIINTCPKIYHRIFDYSGICNYDNKIIILLCPYCWTSIKDSRECVLKHMGSKVTRSTINKSQIEAFLECPNYKKYAKFLTGKAHQTDINSVFKIVYDDQSKNVLAICSSQPYLESTCSTIIRENIPVEYFKAIIKVC